VQLSQNNVVLDAVVRMVVPMRREFGVSLDAMAFMRDAVYAQQVLAQALTSQAQRLRQYAEIAQRHLRPVATAQAMDVADGLAAVPDFAAQRLQASQRLLQLVGPVAEPLCIRLEQSRTPQSLAALLKLAAQAIAHQRGQPAANDYLCACGQGGTAAS
jgi:hypothetical protein